MTASQGTAPAARQRRWSHRTRTGCFTCRQRRVKCDESKPVCNRCVSANRQCEWYNMRTGSFPSETDSTTTRARSVTPQTSTILRSPPSLEQFDGNENIAELLHLIPMINSMSLPESLEKSLRATIERYLSHLPRRSGRNKALDSAVQCVAIAARKLWVQYSTAQRDSLQDMRHKFLHFDKYDPKIITCYAVALSDLQEALAGGKDSISTDTLCAAALLCYLETLLEGSSDKVHNHMLGVIRIIEHRKASSFHEEFDNCLLLNLVPCIAKTCYWNNTDCFLTRKSWRRLIKDAASPLSGRGRAPIDCFLNSSPLINLVVDCSRLIMGQRKLPQPGRDLQHQLLLEKLGKAGDKFFRWSGSLFPDIFDSHLQLFMEYGVKDIEGESRVTSEQAHEVLSNRILVTLLHHRLYVALGGRDAFRIEKESQDIAQAVAGIHSQQSSGFKRPVALNLAVHAITDTAGQWSDFSILVESATERKLASPEMFGDCMTRMGIKFTQI